MALSGFAIATAVAIAQVAPPTAGSKTDLFGGAATQPLGPTIINPNQHGSLFDGAKEPLPLGKVFQRPSAGIAFRPPAGWLAIVEAGREELVRFVDRFEDPKHNAKTGATLVLTRQAFDKPQHLFQKQEIGKEGKSVWVPGIVENTLHALVGKTRDVTSGEVLGALEGAKILRAGDPTNIGNKDVGMIIIRYTRNGERYLAQHAIIEIHSQLYLMLSLTTPGRKDIAEDDRREEKTSDPLEAQAVGTFRKIIDSVELLDMKKFKEDQDERLFRTRGLLVNLNERALYAKLIPERWVPNRSRRQKTSATALSERSPTETPREATKELPSRRVLASCPNSIRPET